nr:cobalamin-binding protein [Solirubrobacterales bacterium]
MRIASLIPSATEAVHALGLGADLVAVTHECDHPPAVESLPRLTRSVIAEGLGAGEIDARVRELTGRGESLYELDERELARVDPELIITQALCAVCAVSYDDVRALAERMPSRPEVLSLDPAGLDEVFGDMVRIAAAAGAPERGERLRDELRRRVRAVSCGPSTASRVLALEWLDPPYLGGHWVPEMVAAAGAVNL